jgi:nucleotide-binding universal stress UspA family protein
MESIALLCTDGSDPAIEALQAALPLLAPTDRTIVVTVESPADPELTTGTGFSGPASADLSAQIETTGDIAAKQHLDETVAVLGLHSAEIAAVVGKPGEAICALAESLSVSVIVMGTSGRSGLRRAMIGSTSDHVVRHAPCPVLVKAVGPH